MCEEIKNTLPKIYSKELINLLFYEFYTKIDYIKICSTKTLKDVNEVKGPSVIALAVKVGTTRLIDNHVFGDKLNV